MRVLRQLPARVWATSARSHTDHHHDEDVDLLSPELRSLLATGRLRQSSSTTCGSVSLLLAAAVANPHTAEALATSLPRREAQMAAWTTGGWRAGRFVWPWPRFWGTSPWAAAAAMSAITGRRHRVHRLDPREPGQARAVMVAALAAGSPAPLFVGSATLPRHVVLLVGTSSTGFTIANPGDGRSHTIGWDELGRARFSGWTRLWAVISAAPRGS